MSELWEKYKDWIDESIYDGLTDEEHDELEDKLEKEFGMSWILRKDAPQEAVSAWEEESRIRLEAAKKGIIVD